MPRPQSILLTVLAMIFAAALSVGCAGTKRQVILIEQGEPVQLAESVKALVFISRDGSRIRSDSKVTIPAGWWALPDPGDGEPSP